MHCIGKVVIESGRGKGRLPTNGQNVETELERYALYVALTVKLKRKYRLEWRFLSWMSGVKNIILVKPKKCDDNSASDYPCVNVWPMTEVQVGICTDPLSTNDDL